jgi:hypothetical protein
MIRIIISIVDDDEGVEVGVDFRRKIEASDRSDFVGFCARVSREILSPKTSSHLVNLTA